MQYIHVKLLNGFAQPLTYLVPLEYQKNLIGLVVKVPLKDTFVSAYVVGQSAHLKENPKFKLKEMVGIEPFPEDHHFKQFIVQLSNYYQVDSLHFIKRIRQFVNQSEQESLSLSDTQEVLGKSIQLTQEQQTVVDEISPSIGAHVFAPALLHGVTGSGKTEVYKQLILKTIAQKKVHYCYCLR